MQLVVAITASLLLASSVTATTRGIVLYTEKGFGGVAASIPVAGAGVCHPVNEPYISHLGSAHAYLGSVCKMFTDTDCSRCAACIDFNVKFTDMTSVPPVHSFLCEPDSQFVCSNVNSCPFPPKGV
ncbi:hypothetical protein B0H14DRAFT_3142127 [Mycena olivaceomarginata]|nr:hypothetical protein B0H14DRAFT_3142127 [Mycena olivaceomarginata]